MKTSLAAVPVRGVGSTGMCVWCLAVLLAASPAPGRAGDAAEGAVEMVPNDGTPGSLPNSINPSGAAPHPRARGAGGMRPLGYAGALDTNMGMPRTAMYGMFSPPYGLGPRPLMAMAMIMANEMAAGDKPEAAAGSAETAAESEGVSGVLELQDMGSHIIVSGNITGLAAGMYGMFLHRSGDMRRGCDGLGMMDPYRPWRGSFIGEVGSVMAGSDGTTMVRLMTPTVSLTGQRGALGRALVLQKLRDMPAPGNPAMNPNGMGPSMMGTGMMGSGMMGSGMMGAGMMGSGMMGSGMMPDMPAVACGLVVAM